MITIVLTSALAPDVASASGRSPAELPRWISQLRQAPRKLSGYLALLQIQRNLDRLGAQHVTDALLRLAMRRLHPLTRTRLNVLRADLLRRRGLWTEAERLLLREGFLRRIEVALLPDDASEKLTATGPQRLVLPTSWRQLIARPGDPVQRVGTQLWTRKGSHWLLLRHRVFSRRRQRAVLRFGVDGRIRWYLNGDGVASPFRGYRASVDQAAVPLRLKRGWNTIVGVYDAATARWPIVLRLSTPGGHPLIAAAQKTRSAPATTPALTWNHETTRAPLALPRTWSNRDRKPPNGSLGALVLEYLLGIRSRRELRDALTPMQQGTVATLSILRWKLRLSPHLGEQLALARSMLRRRITEPEAHLALVRAARAHNMSLVAWRRALRGLAHCPNNAALLLNAIHLARQLRLPPMVWQLRQKLLSAHGNNGKVLLDLASVALDRGEKRVALSLFLRARQRAAHSPATFAQLADLHLALGNYRAASRVLSDARRGFPDLGFAFLQGASQAMQQGDRAQALHLLSELLRRHAHPLILEAAGRLYLRWGNRPEAIHYFTLALRGRSQNSGLNRYLTALRKAAPVPGVSSFLTLSAVRRHLTQSPPALDRTHNRATLSQIQAIHLDKIGLSTTTTQRIWLINRADTRISPTYSITYSPYDQAVTVLSARILRANGDWVPASEVLDRSLSAPWQRVYYDYRRKVIHFPAYKKGDLVEVRYRIHTTRAGFLPKYFGRFVYFADDHPVLQSTIILSRPQAVRVYTRFADPTGKVSLKHSHRVVKGLRIDRWSLGPQDALPSVKHAPPLTALSPYLHISTVSSWKRLAALYWRFVSSQFISSPEIAAQAKKLVRSLTRDEDKLRAVHRFIAKETRYVGLEFGIHGYKPYDAPTVYRRRFGDCKDKATLMIQLLKEVGIRAHLVLVRTADLGRIEPGPASLETFNHAVVYVPKLRRLIDGTAEFNTIDELPVSDQGAEILVIGMDDGLRRTPVAPASRNRQELELLIQLQPGGDALVSGSLRVSGHFASVWRYRLQTTGLQAKRVSDFIATQLDGFKLAKLKVTNAGLHNAAPVVAFSGRVSGFAKRDGSALVFRLGDHLNRRVERLAPKPTRSVALVLDQPYETVLRWTVIAPPGYRPRGASIPPTQLQSHSASGLLLIQRVSRQFVITERFVLRTRWVEVSDYLPFRILVRKLDDARQVALRFQRRRVK